VDVVDLSDGGALVEGIARLLPGTHVDVHVVTRGGRILVRSRIVRAYVCDVSVDALRYRGALAFERVIDTSAAEYVIPALSLAAPGQSGSLYPLSDAANETTGPDCAPAWPDTTTSRMASSLVTRRPHHPPQQPEAS
jgi:hypothetical protein